MKVAESANAPDAQSILEHIAAIGGRVELAGDGLRCHVPQGSLPAALADRIRINKPALIEQLRRAARSQRFPPFRPGRQAPEGPLSSAQRRIWFHERVRRGDAFYLITLVLRLSGEIDLDALTAAWDYLTARHPSLRTRFEAHGGTPRQIIEPRVEASMRLATGPAGGADASTDGLATVLETRFDIAAAPLARLSLLRIQPREHLLALSVHHIVSDGWSTGLLVQELLATYRAIQSGNSPSLPPPAADYLDYALWQEEYLRSAVYEEDLSYWRRALEGAPAQLAAPAADALPEGTAARVRRERIVLAQDLHALVASWARARGGTVYSVMLSALYCLLHLWTDATDIVIGGVVAGRPHPELDGVVGCFINSLPLRCRFDPDDGFAALHERVQAGLVGAWEHQACPFEKIVEAVNPRRAGQRNPIFNVAFLLQNYPHLDTGDVAFSAEIVPLPPTGRSVDLRWIAGEANGELVLGCEYDEGFASEQTVKSLMAAYALLLRQALGQPEQALVEYRESLALSPAPCIQRLVLAGTFTVEPIQEPLEFWLRSLSLPYSIRLAPYAQVVQCLLDPRGALRRHADLGCLLIRLEDWLGKDGAADGLRANLDEFLAACAAYRQATRRPTTIWLCPVSSRAAGTPELLERLREAQAILEARCRQLDMRVARADSVLEKYPVAQIDDEYLGARSHIPYTSEFFTALGTMLARELAARERPPLKAVALDADNTLWRGVCGEDGPDGVVLDEPALALQSFFRELRDQGVALCLCSKNAEADVREVFARRPDMPLRWEDFSVCRVNWRPKSANLAEIAGALNIALDAMAFVDDNPAECAEIEARCAGVLALCLPERREDIEQFLHGVWELDPMPGSQQARSRLQTYETNAAREKMRSDYGDLDGFLRALQVQVTLRELREDDLPRAAELTQRTNQFNVSTKRRKLAELEGIWRSARLAALVVEVSDKFGEYGLTGLVLFAIRQRTLEVDTFLLSCRVLGKRVEHEVLRHLEQLARAQGCERIEIPLLETERNQPARDFLRAQLGSPERAQAGGALYAKRLA